MYTGIVIRPAGRLSPTYRRGRPGLNGWDGLPGLTGWDSQPHGKLRNMWTVRTYSRTMLSDERSQSGKYLSIIRFPSRWSPYESLRSIYD